MKHNGDENGRGGGKVARYFNSSTLLQAQFRGIFFTIFEYFHVCIFDASTPLQLFHKFSYC